jgi:transmembrane sensor
MEHLLDPHYRASELIIRFLKNELTSSEKEELDRLLAENESVRNIFSKLSYPSIIQEELISMNMFPEKAGWSELLARSEGIERTVAPVKKMRPWYYAAAAVIVLLLSLSVWQINNETVPKETVVVDPQEKIDIGPGTSKALLTMADGSTMMIGDSAEGLLSKQFNVDLLVNNGEIRYQVVGDNNQVQYNTITTPNGGQFKIVLADGTKVWINAASSLKYPVAFVGKERRVELQGEGYFEVAPDAEKPFKVQIGNGEVQAIGTAFNINAYSDEYFASTTLIEGKVLINSGDDNTILFPGQQARMNANRNIQVGSNVDTEEVIAWKNGLFIFKSATLEQIMKQIGRWYDVEVAFENKDTTEKFSGIVSRSQNLSAVLKILSEGGVNFKWEEKRITVY